MGAHSHDWQADSFSRGAYSYVAVGGASASERRAAPVDRTVFFAGEALAEPAEIGTVNGAISTGRRAAERWLATH